MPEYFTAETQGCREFYIRRSNKNMQNDSL